MAYSSGGLIAATDYNTFASGATTNASNNLNFVWSTGNGSYGYGQTAVGQVASTNTVTATQWASLINTLNNALTHQAGSGSGISAPTAGGTITWLSTLSSSIGTAYSNRLNYAAQGSTTTGSGYGYEITGTNATFSGTFTRTITWSSGDAARYFFNCGGQINWVITSAANNNGTLRSADLATQWATYQAGGSIKNNSAVPRTGSGGTVNTSATSLGYWSLTTSAQTISQITSANYRYEYNSDYTYVQAYTSAQNASGNGDHGAVIYLVFGWYMYETYAGLNDNVDVTVNHRIDIVAPSTSGGLSASWGLPTIT